MTDTAKKAALILAISVACIIGGLTVGLSPVESRGIACGSYFAPDNDPAAHEAIVNSLAYGTGSLMQAMDEARYIQACDDARGSRAIPAWVLIVGGCAMAGVAWRVNRRSGKVADDVPVSE